MESKMGNHHSFTPRYRAFSRFAAIASSHALVIRVIRVDRQTDRFITPPRYASETFCNPVTRLQLFQSILHFLRDVTQNLKRRIDQLCGVQVVVRLKSLMQCSPCLDLVKYLNSR